MGLFDAIADIGSSIIGGVAGSKANKAQAKAAEKALEFQKEQAELDRLERAQVRADSLRERKQGRRRALQLVNPYMDSTNSDAMLARAMTSRPEVLTPGQQIQLEDLQRRTLNNLSVAGMRGAGRGGQSVLADATRRYMADAYGQNQARSDQAASDLAARGERARGVGVNVETGTTSGIAADINASKGDRTNLANAGAGLIQDKGAANAANWNLLGNTVGAISQIANQDRTYDKYGSSGSWEI